MVKTAYLYGEIHGSEIVNIKEFEIWKDFYNRGYRHLFMEIPCFYSGFLNRWMKSENDEILKVLFAEKVSGNSEFNRRFFKDIKEFCPETIFHGTDIGHSYNTLGEQYLKTVLTDSEEYCLTLENIGQGKKYYEAWQKNADENYIEAIREKDMAKNFIREFDSVKCDIVGFYGEAHVFSEETGTFGIEENMCSKIKNHYAEKVKIIAEFIRDKLKPLYKTKIFLNEKNYDVSCFGDVYTPFDEDCEYIRFFKIENPGNDFSGYAEKENFIPETLYPVPLNNGDVFVIDSLKNGEKFLRQIFVCNGFSEEYGKITTEIHLEEK